jgi:hypothetical protein
LTLQEFTRSFRQLLSCVRNCYWTIIFISVIVKSCYREPVRLIQNVDDWTKMSITKNISHFLKVEFLVVPSFPNATLSPAHLVDLELIALALSRLFNPKVSFINLTSP